MLKNIDDLVKQGVSEKDAYAPAVRAASEALRGGPAGTRLRIGVDLSDGEGSK
jgi:hypothetical protein